MQFFVILDLFQNLPIDEIAGQARNDVKNPRHLRALNN